MVVDSITSRILIHGEGKMDYIEKVHETQHWGCLLFGRRLGHFSPHMSPCLAARLDERKDASKIYAEFSMLG